jgi:hypothetical protein
MTITEKIRRALREYYDIPKEAGISFREEIEEDGCRCCSCSSINLITTWEWTPAERKRKKTMTRWHYGSLTDFLQEIGQ